MIKDMHYSFRLKFNKIDSQQNRNFLIQEIDTFLNQAEKLFVNLVANPRINNKGSLGFEIGQRSIDDIRTIVIGTDTDDENSWLPVTDNKISLPLDYRYFIKALVKISTTNCKDIEGRVFIRQHDDMFQESPLHKSSFEWREVNALFYRDGIKFFTDGKFNVDKVCLNYIRLSPYMHNAENTKNGSYKLADGTSLTGFQDCELPLPVQEDIVDLAIMIASGAIQTSNYQQIIGKLNTNNLI